MIVVFDLDYTLYNTNKLKKELARALGISQQLFQKTYEKNFKEKKDNYNAYKHLSFLQKNNLVKKENIEKSRRQIRKVFQNTNQNLYSGAEKVLKDLKEAGHELILLSFGNRLYQKEKINKLKIKKYFSRIILTDLDKSTSLDFLKRGKKKVVIVNDNARESIMIRKALRTKLTEPKILLVKGHYNNNHRNNFEVFNLSQITKSLEISYQLNNHDVANYKLVANNQDKEIGRAFVVIAHNSHKRPFALLEDVFVEPEYRSEGIGGRLVADALALAKEKKCYKMVATSRYARPKVHEMYRKIGFNDWGKEFRINF